jgi:hypothetical protein
MQLQLESTDTIVNLIINGVAVEARVWTGVSAAGVPCYALVTRVVVDATLDCAEFDRDLHEHAPTPEIAAILARRIL